MQYKLSHLLNFLIKIEVKYKNKLIIYLSEHCV